MISQLQVTTGRESVATIEIQPNVIKHIHLSHVAAGHPIAGERQKCPVEPWESLLGDAYTTALRKRKREDRLKMAELILQAVVRSVELPLMIRFLRIDDNDRREEAPKPQAFLLNDKGLLVIASDSQDDIEGDFVRFAVCTAYFPSYLIDKEPEIRGKLLADRLLRIYARPVVYSNELTPPKETDSLEREAREHNKPYRMNHIRFDSLENWGFRQRDGVWFCHASIATAPTLSHQDAQLVVPVRSARKAIKLKIRDL